MSEIEKSKLKEKERLKKEHKLEESNSKNLEMREQSTIIIYL